MYQAVHAALLLCNLFNTTSTQTASQGSRQCAFCFQVTFLDGIHHFCRQQTLDCSIQQCLLCCGQPWCCARSDFAHYPQMCNIADLGLPIADLDLPNAPMSAHQLYHCTVPCLHKVPSDKRLSTECIQKSHHDMRQQHMWQLKLLVQQHAWPLIRYLDTKQKAVCYQVFYSARPHVLQQ